MGRVQEHVGEPMINLETGDAGVWRGGQGLRETRTDHAKATEFLFTDERLGRIREAWNRVNYRDLAEESP